MPFPQAPAGAQRILDGWRRWGWLRYWERSCWGCSRRMTKQSSPAGSGRGRKRASERRVQSRSTPSEAWVSLDLWTGAESCCHTQGLPPATLQHIQVHFGVDFEADFEDVRWHDEALTWNHTKDHNRSWKLCFHHPGHVPIIRGNPNLHFEGAGNVPVVITWMGREHELYSGASSISLVEYCVTFRHDKRLLSLLGFVHNWPTRRWSATKKRKPVFIKRKWNHVVFSRVTTLSFPPPTVVERTGLFDLGMATGWEERKLWNKTCSLWPKNWLSVAPWKWLRVSKCLHKVINILLRFSKFVASPRVCSWLVSSWYDKKQW